MSKKILVTGAGGFIGGHLCKRLMEDGHHVIGVDKKYPEFRSHSDICNEFKLIDLHHPDNIFVLLNKYKPDWVFALAADMGGMGFIAFNDYQILLNNLRINLNTLNAAIYAGVERYFFSSSVCVYPDKMMQDDTWVPDMQERDAYPAEPSDEYGWEKLTAERILLAAQAEGKIQARIARFQNTYGPYGTWTGGREKAPAALMRKVAESKLRDDDPISIEVWGDGKATRTFMYIDDCVEGIIRLMYSDCKVPVNLGVKEVVDINHLASVCHSAAETDKDLKITHVSGPEGHRNRGHSGDLYHSWMGWSPSISLFNGIYETYPWIEEQVRNAKD